MSIKLKKPNVETPSFQIQDVFIIGCGGIGSHLAGMVAREWFFRKDIYDKRLSTEARYPRGRLIFMDGDVVEAKNLYRQDFLFTDINKPKCDAIASRYRKIMGSVGVSVESKRSWVDEAINEFTESCAVLLCVDNNATRKAVNNALSPHRNKQCLVNSILISGGNREHLATTHVSVVSSRVIRTAPIEHNQPEITNPDDKHPRDESCQSVTGFVKDPQVFRANLRAAEMMFQAFCSFLDGNPMDYCQLWSDVSSLDFRKEPIPDKDRMVIAS